MSLNRALQGLLGGLSGGLEEYTQQRNVQTEADQRARQIAVQEAEAKRMEQGQLFDQRKLAYAALMGDQDLSAQEAQPYVDVGLPFIKGPTGMLRRPQSVEERVQQASIDPNIVTQLATAKAVPEVAENALNRTHETGIENLRSQRSLAELANALKIAQGHDAVSLANAATNAKSSGYTADRMYDRMTTVAGMKPIDAKKYTDWKMTYLASGPARAKYNDTVRQYGPEQTEQWLAELFRTTFGSQVPE
jgi:hypothetical protein